MHNPSTVSLDVEYTADEEEFLKAMDKYKVRFRRPHPTLREILLLLTSLGYRKVEESSLDVLLSEVKNV
jgi:hypothetical protein